MRGSFLLVAVIAAPAAAVQSQARPDLYRCEGCEAIHERSHEGLASTAVIGLIFGFASQRTLRRYGSFAAARETLSRYIPRRGASIGTPEQLIEEFRRYREAGVEYLIFRTPEWADPEVIQLFSDTVARELENE